MKRRFVVVCASALALAGGLQAVHVQASGRRPERRQLDLARYRHIAAETLAASRRAGSLPVARPRFRAAELQLAPGELLTTKSAPSDLLQVIFKGDKTRVNAAQLEASFTPRGIDHDARSGLVAVAAVSRVLLYDPALGEVTILESPKPGGSPFGFVNDVRFDGAGNLLIADQGDEPTAQTPFDGRLWQYSLSEATITRLVGKKNLSNPKLIDLDSRGRILFVDGGAGPVIIPTLEPRYDTLYRVRGIKKQGAKKLYRGGTGILATAFAMSPEDDAWFGNLTELAVLEGKKLRLPCPFPAPFEFITGLAFAADGGATLMDGASVRTQLRWVYRVTAECEALQLLGGQRIEGARGLAIVGTPPEDPEGQPGA